MAIVAKGTNLYEVYYHHPLVKEPKKFSCIGDKQLREAHAYLERKGYVLDREVFIGEC